MKCCSVVLGRLSPSAVDAHVAVRECRVLLERCVAEAALLGPGHTEARAAVRERPRPQRTAVRQQGRVGRVLRSSRTAKAASAAHVTVRQQIGTGRRRSSTRYRLRQNVFSQTVVMAVTRRSCWRRGRTRSKKPPSSSSTSSSAAATSARSAQTDSGAAWDDESGPGSGSSDERENEEEDTTAAAAAVAAPATPCYRRLQCFKHTVEAMVRGDAAAGSVAVFAEYERTVLRNWLELPDDAAACYLRLLGLRGPWARGSNLAAKSPGDGPAPREHFATLERAGFVSSALSHCEVRDVLALLRVPELEQVCVSMGVNIKRRTKLAMVRALTRLHASSTERASLIKGRVSTVLGGFVRVRAVPRELVERALLAVAAWLPVPRDGDRLRAARTLLLKECAQLLVPERLYGTPNPNPGPGHSMFTTRQQLLEWKAVAEERAALGRAIASGRSTEVLTIGAEALKDFRKHLESSDPSPAAATIGGGLADLLDAASEALVRESDMDAVAVAMLGVLLRQRQHGQHRRASWASRLATLLLTRQGDLQGAAELLVRELEDEGHRGAHRCRLQERARTVLRAKGTRGVQDDTRLRLQALLPSKDEGRVGEFRTLTVRSRVCSGSVRGMKRVYVHRPKGQETAYLSVEERVMHDLAGEYPRGVDDEGETLVSLSVLALWGAVHDAEVPDVWGTPLQDRPLDWGTDNFWVARHLAMEQRLEDMERRVQDAGEEAAGRELADALHKAREARRGTPCLVRWDLLEGLDIEEFMRCLKVKLFVAICRRFFQDFSSNRHGFPDLHLWNPQNGKSLFVEVKGPHDIVSAHQVDWLEFLRSHGAEVALAIVQVQARVN